MRWASADLAGLNVVRDTSRSIRPVDARKAQGVSVHQIGEIAPPRSSQDATRGRGPDPSEVWPWDAMNKTESRYAREHLQHNPDVIEWHYESINLRLGENLFYRPDFFVVMSDGRRRFVEVKGGYVREDAEVKFKAAALRYTLLAYFEMWQWTKKGGWVCIREI